MVFKGPRASQTLRAFYTTYFSFETVIQRKIKILIIYVIHAKVRKTYMTNCVPSCVLVYSELD